MERKQLRIGMLGTGWMCRTHCHAYSTANYMYNSDRWQANLSAVAGSSPAKGAAAAERYGFVRSAANWQELASAADVDVFDNVAPDALHVEPTDRRHAVGQTRRLRKADCRERGGRAADARCGAGDGRKEPVLLQLSLYAGSAAELRTDPLGSAGAHLSLRGHLLSGSGFVTGDAAGKGLVCGRFRRRPGHRHAYDRHGSLPGGGDLQRIGHGEDLCPPAGFTRGRGRHQRHRGLFSPCSSSTRMRPA